MTTEETAAIDALVRCTFRPASHDKYFVRAMATKRKNDAETPLTPKQAAFLQTLLHRYRRQHGACRCNTCRAGVK